MAKRVTKEELKELIQSALDRGLSNKEMADEFNAHYGDESSKLAASDIPKLKEIVGLKGAKPKKKKNPFFEIVEEAPIEEPSYKEIEEAQYDYQP